MSVLFSAIIATYNQAAYLRRAIDSALAQQLPPNATLEVIVVDDASTDTTRDVAAGYGARIQYLRQQANGREGPARNTGAAHASGTYFAFLDSDDYWLPGKLAKDFSRFEAHDHPALVYSRGRNVDPSDRTLGERHLATPQGDVFWHLAREAFIPMSTVAVRADAFRACRGFVEDRDLSGTADWELWMRLAARWPVGFVDQTATCIRVHGRNMSADPSYMERAMLAAIRHVLSDPVVARRARGREQFIRACMYVTIALNTYANRRRDRSWLWLARALTAWPQQALDPRFVGAAARVIVGPTLLRKALRRSAAASA
jgi:glycosyltransferase involved in cell wall biosynthesis